MENADGAAAPVIGYAAGQASHMFEEFLEYRLGHDTFWEWLMHYPSSGAPGADPAVEDEVDRAILALYAFHEGHRTWGDVHRELMDCRSRLTGLARF